jgi:hypothetical protein
VCVKYGGKFSVKVNGQKKEKAATISWKNFRRSEMITKKLKAVEINNQKKKYI